MIYNFPDFDPVLLHLGPISIRWYALSYIVGILLAWWMARHLIARYRWAIAKLNFDDFVVWATIGVLLGGRLGYVLLWSPITYLSNPLEIFYIWKGGMAFHGGLLGVISALILFSRTRKIPFFVLSDLVATVTPIALFLGRIANFINGELVGRPTDGTWGMIFPREDNLPRHPSQLYEAALEGILLFLLMLIAARSQKWRDNPGKLTGLFLSGYAIARSFSEFFREPEINLGEYGFVTWGQILSIPMLIFGLYLIFRKERPALPGKKKS